MCLICLTVYGRTLLLIRKQPYGKFFIQERESGQRLNIIIVSEGAIDREGNPITAEMIRQVQSPSLFRQLYKSGI